MAGDPRWLVLCKPLRVPLRDGTTVMTASLVRGLPAGLEVAYLGDPATPLRPGRDRVLAAGAIGYAPGLRDRARLLATLVDPRLAALPVHLVFTPSRLTASLLATVRRVMPGRAMIQTVPASDGVAEHARELAGLDAVVVTSEHARERLIDAGARAERIHCVHPGVELSALGVDDPGSARRILYAGDLEPAVADRLIAIAELLRRPELVGVKLVIAARPKGEHDAAARSELRRRLADDLAAGRVELAGEIEDMDRLLRTSSLVVHLADHTRRKVDLPLVLLEAMARGIPIAVVDRPPACEIFTIAARESLTPGVRLVSDPTRLAAQLAAAMVEHGALLGWGRDARTLVARRFDTARMVQGYLAIYRAVGPLS